MSDVFSIESGSMRLLTLFGRCCEVTDLTYDGLRVLSKAPAASCPSRFERFRACSGIGLQRQLPAR